MSGDRGAQLPQPAAREPAELVEQMTLSEKAGQLVGTFVGSMGEDVDVATAKSMIREAAVGTVAAFGIGISWYHDPATIAELANEFQRTAIRETRLGIPLLVPVDAVHGHAYVNHAAVFPHALGIAAGRDPALSRRCGEVTAATMRATGANLNYAPTCDVAWDQRWGRCYETYGESSLLCAEFAAAAVGGMQEPRDGEGVAATAKHFPAYGDPAGGEDSAVVDRSPSTVYRTFVRPFEAAIDAGVDAVMPCYNSIDGEPAHGSRRYLTRLLRERLGFTGPVVSDWGGVDMLYLDHATARSERDAARQAFDAGLDQVSVGGDTYAEHVVALVEAGDLSIERVDEAVERILRLKADLGLFEDPYVDVERVVERVDDPAHREAALDAARASMTLLKNEDGTLPLSPELDSVFVTGPNADDLINQLGGWSVQEAGETTGVTIREGVERVVGDGTTVTYEPGATTREPVDVEAAARAAADADAAVVVCGENWYIHEFGPQQLTGLTGEFPTRTGLSLPDAQRDLLSAVHATGTPTVLVTVTGRPLSITWAAEHVPAILHAYFPGSEGGLAVAETLFGEHNPAGRLPISIPKSTGHLPCRFDYPRHPTPIGADEHQPSYDPLYPFGHGLSYTDFECRDLVLSDHEIGPAESVTARLTVENVGDRAGARGVDLFLTDEVSSRVRPVREHVGFDAVHLAPGEEAAATIEVPNDALAVTDSAGRRTVEPGEFTVSLAGLSATFDVVSRY